MFTRVTSDATCVAGPRGARGMKRRCFGFAAAFILAALLLAGEDGSLAWAQSSTNQENEARVVRQQTYLQVQIQKHLRKLTQQAERALEKDDCGQFAVLFTKISNYRLTNTNPVYAYLSETDQSWGLDPDLTDYQIGEIRKYATNRLSYLQRLQAVSCGQPSTANRVSTPTPYFIPSTDECLKKRGATPRASYAPADAEFGSPYAFAARCRERVRASR